LIPAVIAIGSNLGDREANLRAAVADLAAIDGVTVDAASGIVESHAWKPAGVDEDAPNYLNAVVLVRSALLPEQLLDELNRIESEHGRVRAERWGDRTLDLDIVTFGAMRISSERLTLPHPRAGDRPFVVVPWLQVEPGARLPGHGPIAELAAAASAEVWPYAASPLWNPSPSWNRGDTA
jgi:2-amino-4-hydroxy-6-hydroxymethyldihydropteridine diphosphokinase